MSEPVLDAAAVDEPVSVAVAIAVEPVSAAVVADAAVAVEASELLSELSVVDAATVLLNATETVLLPPVSDDEAVEAVRSVFNPFNRPSVAEAEDPVLASEEFPKSLLITLGK